MGRKVTIVAIGGGHATKTRLICENLRESLQEIFTSVKIQIVDLDELTSNKDSKTYTDADYDFGRIYDELRIFKTGDSSNVYTREIILLYGCYALYDDRINELSDVKIFIESDPDVRLINLIRERGIETPDSLSKLINEYVSHLRVEMQKYIEPTRINSDIIIPYSNNTIGTSIILDGIVNVIKDGESSESETKTHAHLTSLSWDFETERIDTEKLRYYDAS